MLIKFLKTFATVWFVLAGLLMFSSMLMIWHAGGVSRVQEIFSPFNVLNVIPTMVILTPGIGAYMLARMAASRRSVRPLM
jgi:hypothetical protein